MAWQLKGKIAECKHREYGFAHIHAEKSGNGVDALFGGLGDEFEVRRKVVTAHGQMGSPWSFSRSGCHMEINSLKSLPVSTSLGVPPMPRSQPSPTMTSHGTVFSSIRKSPTLHADERSLESLFLTFVVARRTGQWSVTSIPECGGTLLTVTGVVIRKNSSARKSHASARSVDQREE